MDPQFAKEFQVIREQQKKSMEQDSRYEWLRNKDRKLEKQCLLQVESGERKCSKISLLERRVFIHIHDLILEEEVRVEVVAIISSQIEEDQ